MATSHCADSDAANSDAFCDTHLTFRDDRVKFKKEDDQIRASLEKIQPAVSSFQQAITAEPITGVTALPRGACTGSLIGDDASSAGGNSSSSSGGGALPGTKTDEPSGDSDTARPATTRNTVIGVGAAVVVVLAILFIKRIVPWAREKCEKPPPPPSVTPSGVNILDAAAKRSGGGSGGGAGKGV